MEVCLNTEVSSFQGVRIEGFCYIYRGVLISEGGSREVTVLYTEVLSFQKRGHTVYRGVLIFE